MTSLETAARALADSLERRARWKMAAGQRVWEASRFTDERPLHMWALSGQMERDAASLRNLLPADPQDREEVGTGAGEDAPRQDTGSARVTRSEDCPEAPAQAHPLTPDTDPLAEWGADPAEPTSDGTDRSLPGCGECGGTVKHARTCTAYDPAKVLTAPGGWCPAATEPEPEPADADPLDGWGADPDTVTAAMIDAGAWALLDASMDTSDREPSPETYDAAKAAARAFLARMTAPTLAARRDALAKALSVARDPGEHSPLCSDDALCRYCYRLTDAVLTSGAVTDLHDASRDATVGAVGENPEEPLDPEVRRLATLAYLVTTCEVLGVDADDEWDGFAYARAVHRRVRALASQAPAAPPVA